MTFDWDLYLNFTAAMLALLNPLTKVPLWTPLTGDVAHKSRRQVAALATGTALLIILLFLLFGQNVLRFLSIELKVFKIAGGLLLLFAGLDMVNGKTINSENLGKDDGKTDFEVAKSRFRKIFTPMTFPMLAGPGALTTAILFGNRADQSLDYVALSVILAIIIGVLWVSLAFSYKIEDKIDGLGLMAFLRIFGVLLTAIGIQFIVEGLGDVFPALLQGKSVLESVSSK